MFIQMAATRSRAPLPIPRRRWWGPALLAALLAAAFAAAAPAQALQRGVVQFSAAPYTPANAPT